LSKLLPLVDRSRIVADLRCERRAYLNYEIAGRGVVAGTEAYELFFGSCVHDAAATIAQFHHRGDEVPIDDIAEAGRATVYDALVSQTGNEEYANEQGSLIEGLVRGFYKRVWPSLLATYPNIVVIEQEVVYEVGAMRFMCKPDLVLADEAGNLVYVEHKSASNTSEKWVECWETDPQIHSYMRAIQETTGLEISATIVQGWRKGSPYRGQQSSVFCYAYHRIGQPPFFADETSYTYKAGMKKYPVWKLEGGVKKWVDEMPDDVLDEQFTAVPPVYFDANIADTFFRQASIRRQEINLAKQMMEMMPESIPEIMDTAFQCDFTQCKPSYGSACPYTSLCHPKSIFTIEEVLAKGFQLRTPHHSPEQEYFDSIEAEKTNLKHAA